MTQQQKEGLEDEFRQYLIQKSKGGEMWLLPTVEDISRYHVEVIDQLIQEKVEKIEKKGENIEYSIY